MQKTWAVIPSRANRIKHLARTTIWRPKQMTCDDQIKLTYGALAASCTSCSIWKSCFSFAIPLSCANQLIFFKLKQTWNLAKSSPCISEWSKGEFLFLFKTIGRSLVMRSLVEISTRPYESRVVYYLGSSLFFLFRRLLKGIFGLCNYTNFTRLSIWLQVQTSKQKQSNTYKDISLCMERNSGSNFMTRP